MNCLSEEILMQLALESTGDETGFAEWNNSKDGLDTAKTHIVNCSICREEVEHFRSLSASLDVSHQLFDLGHETYRRRLLAALSEPESTSERVRQNRQQRIDKRSILMRRISIGFATTTLVLLVLGFFYLPRSSTVFAQVVEQLRQAKSFRCKVKMTLSEKAKKEIKPEEFAPMPEMLFYWNAPNSMRNETLKDDKLIQVSVQPSGKPGIEIDYLKKTVRKVPARQSSPSPLILMDNLAHFAGIADRDLGKAVIAGEEVQGFEVAASKIDPDQTVSRVRVWFNPKTKLPVAVEQDYDAFVQRMEDFHWNETTHDWFNINVPEDFRDVSPVPPTLDEITARAVTTFRIFAKYSGGKYPQVKTIDGDVMHSELLRNAGISLFPKREQLSDPVYQECQKAQNGISTIYLIQQENPDAAYYGKEVDSGDKVKILLRWKLSNGEYRVIYGDLHYEDVSLDVLRQLESKK